MEYTSEIPTLDHLKDWPLGRIPLSKLNSIHFAVWENFELF